MSKNDENTNNLLEKLDTSGKKTVQLILNLQKNPENYIHQSQISTKAPMNLTYGDIFTFLENLEAAGLLERAEYHNKSSIIKEDKEGIYFKTGTSNEGVPVIRIKPDKFDYISEKLKNQ